MRLKAFLKNANGVVLKHDELIGKDEAWKVKEWEKTLGKILLEAFKAGEDVEIHLERKATVAFYVV